MVDTCIKALERLHTDQSFHNFFESVKTEAAKRCDEPVLPHQRQIPKQIDDGASQHVYITVEDYYRKEYFEVIDAIKGNLEDRFLQENFVFVQKIETLLMDSANGKEVVVPQDICTMYKKDIDFSKLSLHLKMLPDAIKAVPLDGITIREITRVQTLCDDFNKQASFKMMLSEVHKLVLLYLTVPVTTATAERSFSGLKRIKTYLRNSMTPQRLNQCILLHNHQNKTDNLDLSKIAEEFIKRNDKRIKYFGNISP